MSQTDKPRFFYGWVVVGCCFLASFSYGIFYTFGIFFKPLQVEFGWSATLTSSIQSFHIVMAMVSTLLVGWATDKFGPRLTLACTGTLIGIGISLCSQVNELWQFYLFYGIASLGLGASWALPMATVQRWFVKQRGLTLGIVAAGIGFSVVIYAPTANSLILTYGWRLTYIILGIGTWVILMVAAWLMAASPEKKGLKPLGSVEEVGAESTDATASSHAELWRTGEWSLGEALRTSYFWLLIAIYFCAMMPIQMVIVHLVPFAITIGIDETAAAGALAFIGGLSIAGRIAMGTVAQRTGFRRAIIICTSLCAGALLWLLGVRSLWMIYLFAIIYGFFYGGSMPQVPGLIGYYFPGKSLATILGTIGAIASIGGILGPLVGGFIWDATGSYKIAFIIGTFFWALAAILAISLKQPQKVTS